MNRQQALTLYAPEKYGKILFSHLDDFDIHLNFNINFIPLSGNDPVKVLDDKHVTVTAFPLQHRVPAYGFLFREKPGMRNIIKECIEKYHIPHVRIPAIKAGEDFIMPDGTVIKNEELTHEPPKTFSYAYCSDTMYFSRLASFVRGVDLLYHEATFDSSLAELAKITGHSTTFDAARTAIDAMAGDLIIGHFSARYRDITPLVEETRSLFPKTSAAIDGKTYEIGRIEYE
jgi:ribonuclease Z